MPERMVCMTRGMSQSSDNVGSTDVGEAVQHVESGAN
jgi:hypothetical protein